MTTRQTRQTSRSKQPAIAAKVTEPAAAAASNSQSTREASSTYPHTQFKSTIVPNPKYKSVGKIMHSSPPSTPAPPHKKIKRSHSKLLTLLLQDDQTLDSDHTTTKAETDQSECFDQSDDISSEPWGSSQEPAAGFGSRLYNESLLSRGDADSLDYSTSQSLSSAVHGQPSQSLSLNGSKRCSQLALKYIVRFPPPTYAVKALAWADENVVYVDEAGFNHEVGRSFGYLCS